MNNKLIGIVVFILLIGSNIVLANSATTAATTAAITTTIIFNNDQDERINILKDKNCLYKNLPENKCDYEKIDKCLYQCKYDNGIESYNINYNDGSISVEFKTYEEINQIAIRRGYETGITLGITLGGIIILIWCGVWISNKFTR